MAGGAAIGGSVDKTPHPAFGHLLPKGEGGKHTNRVTQPCGKETGVKDWYWRGSMQGRHHTANWRYQFEATESGWPPGGTGLRRRGKPLRTSSPQSIT
jgi:hypothetical protein